MKNPNTTIINSNYIFSAKVDVEPKFSGNKYYYYSNNRNETISHTQMENIIGLELQKHYEFLEDDNVNIQIKSEFLKEERELFESQCNDLEQQLKEIKSQIQSLKQKKVESSNYQSTTRNFNLSDDDHNNIIFNNDIIELQDTLENYVTNLTPKINININEVKKLLIKYGCQSKIFDKEPTNKLLVKAILQRHVLEEILTQADFYFTRSNKNYYPESDITPIRLRRQIYIALGTRGFNDISTSDGIHNLIYVISKKINMMMNKYRVIKDIKKKKYVNSLAKDLVISVIRIFYFSLLIQEPGVKYHWFNNNEKINQSYMKGSWDEDEIEDLVVEVCSFPLIFKSIYPNGFKVCAPAKVFPVHIMK
ncbi:hypothetical protein RclHR1_22870001 [Rhizophagus clarus]|nr:hypothetical protein RclHR1_22870001 [Rhizophagus clarus]